MRKKTVIFFIKVTYNQGKHPEWRSELIDFRYWLSYKNQIVEEFHRWINRVLRDIEIKNDLQTGKVIVNETKIIGL